MNNQQTAFIKFALKQEALLFGEFTLKSGRVSPYFFNAGKLTTCALALKQLGEFYAEAYVQAGLKADVLFGPAYKGIPIATAMATALANQQPEIGITFNRKEAKNHGEKGLLVGASLSGKQICVVDDVITAGTAIREVMPLLENAGGSLACVLIALDRQEKIADNSAHNAVSQIKTQYAVPVVSLVTLEDILTFCQQDARFEIHTQAMQDYHARYYLA